MVAVGVGDSNGAVVAVPVVLVVLLVVDVAAHCLASS